MEQNISVIVRVRPTTEPELIKIMDERVLLFSSLI